MKNDAIIKVFCFILISINVVFSQTIPSAIISNDKIKLTTNDTIRHLNLPERLENAIGGSELVNQVTGWSIIDREKAIVKEIMSGNIPAFSRKLKPLKITQEVDGESYELILFTTLDYIAIGSNEDYLYTPMTPSTAQYLVDTMNCLLPTKKMVDLIYNQAVIKLLPQPIPPSDTMTTIPVFWQHTDSIKYQMHQMGFDRSAHPIVAGHKKDIIISNKIYPVERTSGRVVIYGWHLSKNKPIQPVYNGHHAGYADYSHGTRLISKFAFINGEAVLVEDILRHQKLSILLSDEGVINKPNYPQKALFSKE